MPEFRPINFNVPQPTPSATPKVADSAIVTNLTTNGADIFAKLAKYEGSDKVEDPIATSTSITKRYDAYNPYLDNEEIAAQNQSALKQALNGIIKGGIFAATTFAEGLMSIPDQIRGLSGGNVYKNEVAEQLDEWRENSEDYFPNYVSKWQKEHPFASAIPFSGGAANFWFDKVVKNAGFTVGAIGSAVLTDAAVGAVTEGIGEIPLVANQIGKASLYLNKLFSTSKKALGVADDGLEVLLNQAREVGQNENAVLTLRGLSTVASRNKIKDNVRYMATLWGSAHTEAAIEARDGYKRLKEDLIAQYQDENGKPPTGEALEEIEKMATAAGNTRYGINMGILMVSNAIQFETILKPFSSFKNSMKAGVQAQVQNQTGRIGVDGAVNVLSDIDNLALTSATKGSMLSNAWNKALKPMIPNILSEGVYEEGGQYAAEKGVEHYFKKKYNRKDGEETASAMESVVYGLGQQFGTAEGLENMFIGGLSGGLFSMISEKVSDRKQSRAGILNSEQANQLALSRLKDFGVTGLFDDNFDYAANTVKRQKDIQQAVANNNVFEFKNLKADSFFDFIMSGIKAKRHDVRIEQLKMMKELSNEEFNKMFNTTEEERADAVSYIDQMIKTANEIKSTHDSISKVFQNPFTYRGNATKENHLQENNAYLAFEDYKAALVNTTFQSKDFNNRINKVQQQLNEISPLLSQDVLKKLSSKSSLLELSSEYLSESVKLEKQLEDKTLSKQERANIRKSIKMFDTLNRAIKTELSKDNFDEMSFAKLYNNLLNFETSDRKSNSENAVPFEKIFDVINLGVDLNKLVSAKSDTANLYNFLLSQQGYDSFLKEYDIWKEAMSLGNKKDSVKVEDDTSAPEGYKANRNYSLVKDSSPKYTISKNGEVYDLKDPNGNVIDSFKTLEAARTEQGVLTYNLNNKLKNIKIVSVKDSIVEVEDSEGNIQKLDKSLLNLYALEKNAEEEAEANVENNNNFSDNLDKNDKDNASDVPTDNNFETNDEFEKDDFKKPINILFSSTTYNHKTSGNKPIIKRQQIFLKAVNDLEGDYKVILVTKNNEDALGLTGLINDVIKGSNVNVEDPYESPILQVYVKVEGKNKYYVNQRGEKIGKVGEKVDINQVVGGTLPTPSLTWSNGDVRYSKADLISEEHLQEYSKTWAEERKRILSLKDKTETYDFTVSDGIALRNQKDANGVRQRNHVGGTLIDKKKQATNGILSVMTQDSFAYNGKQYTFPLGSVIFKHGSTVIRLKSRKFTEAEAVKIFKVFKQLAKDASGKKGNFRFNDQLYNYLQHILYLGSGVRNISFNKKNGVIVFGENLSVPLNEEGFELNKLAIVEFVKDLYINVNNKKLNQNTSFEEILDIDENGEITSIVWKNYQSYLISDRYALVGKNDLNKSPRAIEDTPVTTDVQTPTEDSPNIVHVYSTMFTTKEGSFFTYTPIKESPKVKKSDSKKVAPENKPAATGKFVLDGVTKNIFVSPTNHKIEFTIKPEGGEFTIVITKNEAFSKTVEAFKSNGPLVHKLEEQFGEAFNEDMVSAVIKTMIENDLEYQDKTILTTEEPVVNTPSIPEGYVEFTLNNGLSVSYKFLPDGNILLEPESTSYAVNSLKTNKPLVESVKQVYPDLSEEKGLELAIRVIIEQAIENNINNNNVIKFDINGNQDIPKNHPVTEILKIYTGNKQYFNLESTGDVVSIELDKVGLTAEELFSIRKNFSGKLANWFEKGFKYKTGLSYEEYKNSLNNKSSQNTNEESVIKKKSSRRGNFRRIVDNNSYVRANLNKEQAWFEERFNIPFHRVETLISTTSGGYAFGQFKDGAVYIYNNSEVGTTYHEAFEAVWNMFATKQEKLNIIKEFRNRQGSFTDRETGETMPYAIADEHSIKEQLAEEFRDYVLNGTLTFKPKVKENVIYKFFKDLINFIKTFFTGNVNNEIELFDRINAGYYKTAPVRSFDSYTTGYRSVVIPGLSVTDSYKVVQGVTIEIFQKIFSPDTETNLADFDELSKTTDELYDEVYEELKNLYLGVEFEDSVQNIENDELREKYTELWNIIDSNWDTVRSLVDDYLATFGIVKKSIKAKQQENAHAPEENTDNVSIEEEENYDKGREEAYLVDQFTFDFSKNAPTSIKLLLATLAKSQFDNITESGLELRQTISKLDPNTYMQEMVEYSSMFHSIMDKVFSANSVQEKEELLKDLAKSNPDFVRLYNRLKFNVEPHRLSIQDWMLRARFYNVFAKQRPEGLIQFVEKDKVYVGSANLNVTVNQKIQSWIDSMKLSENGIVKIENDTYVFDGSVLAKYDVKSGRKEDYIKFLNALEIDFTEEMYDNLSKKDKAIFESNVTKLYNGLKGKKNISELTSKKLGVSGNLQKIAGLYVKSSGQGVESTYYNIERQRVQQYLQPNFISYTVNDINNSSNRADMVTRLPQLGTAYRGQSVYTGENGLLFDEEGQRNDITLDVKYIQGTNYITREKVTTNDKLNESRRILQELNQNLNKNYYILVPADSKTEWMLGMQHIFTFQDFSTKNIWDRINDIFVDYFNSEKAEALNNPNYKGILNPTFNKNGEFDTEAFKEYITNNANLLIDTLIDSGIIHKSEETGLYNIIGIDTNYESENNLKDLTKEQLLNFFLFTEVNYAINNIEMHKLFFGDINDIADPTKRYKSFLSPREASIEDNNLNNALNQEYNKVGDVSLQENDYGFYEFKNHMNTVTLTDYITETTSITEDSHLSKSTRDAYKRNNVSDAQSFSTLGAYREISIKRGFDWSKGQEAQYQYLMALDRVLLAKDTEAGIIPISIGYVYTNDALKAKDLEIVKKGNPHSGTFTPKKPIGSGVSLDNKTFLDKTSVAPLWYSLLRKEVNGEIKLSSNAILYLKMIKDDIAYAIFESGRKIGITEKNTVYSEDGSPNPNFFKGVKQIPFRYYGTQVETGGSHDKNTLGTQLAILASQNLISNGIPIDYTGDLTSWNNLTKTEKLQISKVYSAVSHNMEMLEELQKIGYENLLKKFDIEDLGNSYKINDPKKIEKLLSQELLRRSASENKKLAIEVDPATNAFKIPFEAMAAYPEIKSILFSYIDKLIAKPKINGGQRVQISSVGFEVSGKKIHKGKDKKGRDIFVSEGLKFYEATYDESGKRLSVSRMEVMLPNWFAKELRKAGLKLSDSELIDVLNNTGILNGIGFRIPTQDTNSIEAFTVAGFLPEELGDSIVVPEAITTKAGSDFDIDKLNTYLKNIYVKDGSVHLIPYLGTSISAKTQLSELELSVELGKKVKADENAIDNLDEDDLDEEGFDSFYKKSIENEYIASLEALLLLPENFERLVTPNSTDEIVAVRDLLVELAPNEFGTSPDRSVINRNFMSKLRHLFLVGKAGVGIAASSQTNNAFNQHTPMLIMPERAVVSPLGKFIGDAKVALPHNSIKIDGRTYVTLSNITDKEGRYISEKISQYVNAFVDIAKDPFISQIIQDPSLQSLFLFLEKIGVPMRTTALFINQPIIREYLKLLSSRDSSWFFNKNLVNKEILPIFATTSKDVISVKLTDELLAGFIQKFYSGKKLTNQENAVQRFIMDEFLKYAAMSQDLFTVQRGSNYLTDSSADPNLRLKKETVTSKATLSTSISSLKSLFNATFLGKTKEYTGKGISAIEKIFKTHDPKYRFIINEIINKLISVRGLDTLSYIKGAKLAEQMFLEYAVQTNTKLNLRIKNMLIDESTAVALKLRALKKSLPKNSDLYNNAVLRKLIPIIKNNKADAKNIGMIFRANDPFTSDIYSGAFRELRDNPRTSDLYYDLLRISFLQSGIASSASSYTSYIPFEDYQKIISPIMEKLDTIEGLEDYVNNGMFFKNNWNNTKLVPSIEESFNLNTGDSNSRLYNKDYTELKKANNIKGYLNTLIKVHPNSKEASYPYITMKQYATVEDYYEGRFYKVLLKRLEHLDGSPVIKTPTQGSPYAIFYPVNALGNGYNGNEFYPDLRKSIYSNGYVKLEKEFSNEEILKALGFIGEIEGSVEETVQGSKKIILNKSTEIITREEVQNNKNVLFVFGDNLIRKGLGGQAKQMRGEPNAFGIATKKYPSNDNSAFMTDNELEDNKNVITSDVNKIISELSSGKYDSIKIPPIGIGLAKLQEKAPKTWEHLQLELKRLENYVNNSESNERIKISYPDSIEGVDTGLLQEFSKIDDNKELSDEEVIKLNTGHYGIYVNSLLQALSEDLSSEQLEFLKNNKDFTEDLENAYLSKEGDYTETIRDFVNRLLNENRIEIDTAQGTLDFPDVDLEIENNECK